MPLTPDNLHDVIRHHAPDEDGIRRIGEIRKAAEDFARVIFANVPTCADQTVALRCVREAMMWANAAIVLDGKV